ncbi:ParA family protein [Spirosoma sordidisoli]|uniref:ParA family protein n=1 Tax=Spirosoma sordidisoli TaxID=2502893 RepID=A0A4Q2UG30_9BACT|nr:ParA family protein [Spirosoma sordidisoli]RYC66335.1 ParA family protein [Spirosoma sordidisoli]
MKIITVVQQKGGVGKTTIALNLAMFYRQKGASVALCDADSQGSLTAAADQLGSVGLISVADVLAGWVGADVLIIDTSPRNDAALSSLLARADYALLPIRPGYLDALAIRDTAAIVASSGVRSAGIVLNMVQHRNAVTRDILDVLTSFSIPLLITRIGQRVAYTRSILTGAGVFGTEDTKAQEEIAQLGMEIHFHL